MVDRPRRIYITAQHVPEIGGIVHINQEDAHHLLHVLRLGEGGLIEVSFGRTGGIFLALLLNKNPDALEAKITGALPAQTATSPVHTLLFALCKGEKNDFVVEKATELGTRTIAFFQAGRSVVKLENKQERRLARFEKIALEAAKQSLQSAPPDILLFGSLAEALGRLYQESPGAQGRLICSLSLQAKRLSCFATALTLPLHILVGPEGDFTEQEYALAEQRYSFLPLRLSDSILRSETAALVALAQAEAIWGNTHS